MTHSLEWPSLTCQWLPTVRNAGDEAVEHSLLLGTHTTGEQNYLMVASCPLIKEAAPVAADDEKKTKTDKASPAFDEEKQELGGFGQVNSTVGKIEIKMKVKHEGEVNRYVFLVCSSPFLVAYIYIYIYIYICM
jgi:histone-binding protein RBBP4